AYVGTTLSVFDFIVRCMEDARFRAYRTDPLTRYVERSQREVFLSEKNDYRKLRSRKFDGKGAAVFFGEQFRWIQQFVRLLAEAGVPLLTGSDTYGMVVVGFSLHGELEWLQTAGLRPYDILRASTVTPARYLNREDVSGTLSVGKDADLVLLEKNPLQDIRHTRSIAGVVLKGKWHDKKELQAGLAAVAAAYK
ncbi:MAG TPA: amidohydrolase family protein, partial [Chitinophagaceae bacterium]|nr:amidohydrolase family protein [Chitinophagaceae bacterium]